MSKQFVSPSGRPVLVDALGTARRREQALERADWLITAGQVDADGVDDALASALSEAAEWPEVRVVLLHASAARALHLGADPAPIVDDMYRLALAHGMRAQEAVALCYRVGAADPASNVVPFDALTEIRLLLDGPRQPVRDRVAGLVGLADVFGQLRLRSHEDDTLREIARLAPRLADPERTGMVTAANQALSAAIAALEAFEAGLPEAAELSRRRLESVAERPSWHAIPRPWRRRLDAYRQVIAAVLDDRWLTTDEAAEVTSGVEDDPDIAVLAWLLTPIETWPTEPELGDVTPVLSGPARLMYARAVERGQPPSRAAAAHRRHAEALAAQAWHMRWAAGSALSERIATARQEHDRRSLEAQVLTDPLTGVSNRRAFMAVLERSAGEPSTVVTVDLDRFKRVNDRYGHQVGDVVLQRVAASLAAVIGAELHDREPAHDRPLVARIGGDEFVVAVRGDDEVAGRRLAAELASAVTTTEWSDLLAGEVQRATVGVAVGPLGPGLFESSDLDMFDRKPRHEARALGS